MTKAYLNALAEEGTRQDLIEWLHKLDAERDTLREQIKLCEISLGTFDEGCSSEYWERYPGNPKHQ